MDTISLEKFASAARTQLHAQVGAQLERVLKIDSAELRMRAEAVKALRQAIAASSRAEVIERVAYTWFNRLCALRFMDVNGFTPLGVVSPAANATLPEILQEAKQGHMDESVPAATRNRVLDLLAGRTGAHDPQQDAYRLLLTAACNHWHEAMPFLFERIDDYTELLMPDDLLSTSSVLHDLRAAMDAAACRDVEVIGWLYQFYIADKKKEVDAKVKAGGKVEADEIPAKTSLYTPHWIVRFLVENSLGRLWLLNHPGSQLAAQMPYYIAPETAPEAAPAAPPHDFLRVASPEELTVCDPACGSVHMLSYAFDLLYAIYAEEGYAPTDIPRLILTRNLVGLEIDPRAAALAAFALTMKARAVDKRFFARRVQPRITLLHAVELDEAALRRIPWLQAMESDLLEMPARDALLHDAAAWAQAHNVGSLLRPQLTPAQIALVRSRIARADDLFGNELNERVRDLLAQAEPLAQKYHVVVTNPPYLSKGFNDELKEFVAAEYEPVKSDLFSAFIVRNLDLALPGGQLGFMTPFVWMFISSYEKLRRILVEEKTITALVQLEYGGFESAVVPICAFTVENAYHPEFKGGYVRLADFKGADNQAPKTLEAISNPDCGWFYRAAAADFKKIPGAPIAYWVSNFNLFSRTQLSEGFESGGRNKTHDNERFTRLFWEVPANHDRWQPYANGGAFRKYYGNVVDVVDWSHDAQDYYESFGGLYARKHWGCEGITWSKITSAISSFRLKPEDSHYSSSGLAIIPKDDSDIHFALAYLNSPIAGYCLNVMNPTLTLNSGDVLSLPYIDIRDATAIRTTSLKCSRIARQDWDAYETSWDFTTLPLLQPAFRGATLAATWGALREHWQAQTLEMQRLEQENNRIFIDAYGLQDELTPEVPLEEITLTCNPHYRYGAGKSEAEYEALLRADTMREFISYGVGCMFGRYALDKPGLVLANQGETLDDFLRQVPRPTFAPDRDNVIPILDGEWFADDIVERFKRFLRVTFGNAHFDENLAFIEEAIGRDIRAYFVRDFYNDHVKRYQKRPIYWLFSSPKGSFSALIYMHRYKPDTVSVVLNDYLRAYRAKLEGERQRLERVAVSASATARERTQANKEIARLEKVVRELTEYENDVLYPLAARKQEIDLDDGVKVNYAKMGPALRRIVG